MILAACRFSYSNARVRTLKSQLLGRADYESMSLVSGYHGLAEYLKTTAYQPELVHFPSTFDGLFQMYYQDLFNSYERVSKMVDAAQKKLILHLYQKYELENLKTIVRIIAQQRNQEGYLLPLEKQMNFSAEVLLKAKDLTEILSHLRRTWYYYPLKNSLYRFEEEKSTFPIEMALDLAYFSQLWAIISSLRRQDRKITRNLLGVLMDIINLTWFFRFKEEGRLSPEEILNYTLIHGKYINPNLRQKLAYSLDQESMIANLSGTPYEHLLTDLEDQELIEARLWSYLLSLIKRIWLGFPFQIGTILGYLFLKEIELKNLIALTEAQNLNLSRDLVAHYLILDRA